MDSTQADRMLAWLKEACPPRSNLTSLTLVTSTEDPTADLSALAARVIATLPAVATLPTAAKLPTPLTLLSPEAAVPGLLEPTGLMSPEVV